LSCHGPIPSSIHPLLERFNGCSRRRKRSASAARGSPHQSSSSSERLVPSLATSGVGLVAHPNASAGLVALVVLRACAEWLLTSTGGAYAYLFIFILATSAAGRSIDRDRGGDGAQKQRHGRSLLPRAQATGVLLPHRQDPLRAARAHRRHPDAAVSCLVNLCVCILATGVRSAPLRSSSSRHFFRTFVTG
jgi:hypothetical protein